MSNQVFYFTLMSDSGPHVVSTDERDYNKALTLILDREHAQQSAIIKTEFVCSQCHLKKEMQKEGGTGYARNESNELVCYDCCGINDRETLANAKPGDKFLFYLTSIDLFRRFKRLSLITRRVSFDCSKVGGNKKEKIMQGYSLIFVTQLSGYNLGC